MVKLWQMVGAVALVALGAWLTAMLAGVPDVPKSFINALCRRLLRDDLTTEERADMGRLIEAIAAGRTKRRRQNRRRGKD